MATRTIDLRDTSKELAELVGRAEKGDEIIFSRSERPIARLVVLGPGEPQPARRRFGRFRNEIELAEDSDAPLPDEV